MLFSFHCPACKGKIEADASLSGSQAECPQCGKPVAVPEPRVAAGTTLAGFRLERRLGKGGMGEVYLARQLSVKRQVAVKILPPGFASNPEAVQRFMHEGRLAAKLDHFNIVTVFEAGEDNGIFYLAMAYIEGESLDQRLKRDKVLPEGEALTVIRTIADALAYAWGEFQLLHRDLKPANIMVDRRGRVFLMDLGLAKSLGEESGMTLSGVIVGTPQYMSPEQAMGSAELSVPTDIYALGATLYHLVTGAPPFSGDSALKVLSQHVNAPLPPPRSRNPQVTEACSHLLETMMAKQPAERYGDWRALIADIDRVLQGKALRRHPLEPAVRSGSARAAAVPPTLSKDDLARQARQALDRQQRAPPRRAAPTPGVRPQWLTISLLAAVVVPLVLVGAIVATRRGPVPAPGSQAVAAKPPAPAAVAPAQPASAAAPTVARSATQTPPKPETAHSAAPVLSQPWTVPDLGLELVWVAPGSFQMGAADVAWPVHAVRISRGYWVGKYEVTQVEYEAAMGTNPSTFKGARNPVEMVSWDDAVAFCTKLTEREQKAGRLPGGYEYRLPTEAEWEYAARGGAKSQGTSAGSEQGFTYSGSNTIDEVAWYYGNSGDRRLDDAETDAKKRQGNLSSNGCRAHPVGQKKPNELGLYDLSGNVLEWCLDWYDESCYSGSPGTDPVNMQAASFRVFRGGSWLGVARFVRSAFRFGLRPDCTYFDLGFRVCLAPAIVAE